MIFPADAVALIQRRSKSQQRIPVEFVPDRQPAKALPCRYKAGQAYRVQAARYWTVRRLAARARVEERIGSSRARSVLSYLDAPLDATLPPFGLLITVMDVRQEPLGALTQQDARREGFRFTAEFLAAWERQHGPADPDRLVWVLTFGVGDLRDRFDRPRLLTSIGHIGHVEFEVDRAGRQHWPAGDDHSEDYTDRPDLAMGGSADPGEALTAAQLAALTSSARRRDSVRTRTELAETPRQVRVAMLEALADGGSREAQRSLWVIDQRLQAAERKHSRSAAA